MLYQENMLVNWSSHLRSTISDIEIDYCLVEKPTLFSIPGHHKPIEFGLIYDIALKVLNSGRHYNYTNDLKYIILLILKFVQIKKLYYPPLVRKLYSVTQQLLFILKIHVIIIYKVHYCIIP